MRPDSRPEWLWAAALVVGVLAWSWLSVRPVLASTTTRYQWETGAGTCSNGWTFDSDPGHDAGACYANSSTGSNPSKSYTGSQPFVINVYGGKFSGAATTAQWRVDGGAWTTYSNAGTLTYRTLLFSTGTLTAGTHTLEINRPTNSLLTMIDFAETVEEDPPTTTTTAPPTTTTTVPPTTTTTVPPTTTTTVPPSTTTTVPPTTTTTGPGVPESLSVDPNEVPVSSMLAIGGLVGGIISGSALTRLMRP